MFQLPARSQINLDEHQAEQHTTDLDPSEAHVHCPECGQGIQPICPRCTANLPMLMPATATNADWRMNPENPTCPNGHGLERIEYLRYIVERYRVLRVDVDGTVIVDARSTRYFDEDGEAPYLWCLQCVSAWPVALSRDVDEDEEPRPMQ